MPTSQAGGSLGPPAGGGPAVRGGRAGIPTPVPQEGRGVEGLLYSKGGAAKVNDGSWVYGLWLQGVLQVLQVSGETDLEMPCLP